MANNPYVNKVQKADGSTLIDLTSDTASESDVLAGKYFHKASGERVQGSLSVPNVYDGLDSSSTTDALSANQGKQLKTKIDEFLNVKGTATLDSSKTLAANVNQYVPYGTLGMVVFSCVNSKASGWNNTYYGVIVVFCSTYYKEAILLTNSEIYVSQAAPNDDFTTWRKFIGSSVTM